MNRTEDNTPELVAAIGNFDVPLILKLLTGDEMKKFLKVVTGCKKCFGRGFTSWISYSTGKSKFASGDTMDKAPKITCSCVRKAFRMIVRDRRGTTGSENVVDRREEGCGPPE